MALTTAQQAKMDELKELVETMNKTVMGSYSMQNLYGSYFREEFQKLDAKLKEVENA